MPHFYVWCVVCVLYVFTKNEVIEMTKGISIRDAVVKIDKVLGITAGNNTNVSLNMRMFKRIMMVEPDSVGPVITSERNCREKYRSFCELGIVNDTGRINVDLFTKIVKNEGVL